MKKIKLFANLKTIFVSPQLLLQNLQLNNNIKNNNINIMILCIYLDNHENSLIKKYFHHFINNIIIRCV